MQESKKTQVSDIDRVRFDFRDEDKSGYKAGRGLTADIVREISKMKNEPSWMLEHRLRSLEVYGRIPVPVWGPPLGALNMDDRHLCKARHQFEKRLGRGTCIY